MDIGTTLKQNIEQFGARINADNPLFVNARLGKLTPQHISQYLANVLFLIQHTPIHLEKARRLSLRQGNQALANFFADKIDEESGHDKWAESDLEQLRTRFTDAHAEELSPALKRLVLQIEATIEKDPALYLGYMFLSEYLTVLLGPSWLKNLETHCGIPTKMMSVIGNHAELDKDHIQDDLSAMEKFLDDSRLKPLIAHVSMSMELYNDFISDVGSA